MNNILMLGTFDSKGKEFENLYNELERRKVNVISMDTGIFKPEGDFIINISSSKVAKAGEESIEELRSRNDRGYAMRVMCNGARKIVKQMYEENKIQGIISMGGGGGTSIATAAMQVLPIGFPKVCITTLASGDTREYVGTKDIVLFPSIVDICGINRFSRMIISRAAGAVCGMAEMEPILYKNEKDIICISMFGNSTPCIEKCVKLLEDKYATLVFHATGSGGKSMEELILEGHCKGCLDITTTEWADELCGGILSAGPSRLDAPGKIGIPHVIVPGCLDMVNFGGKQTIPQKYRNSNRIFYEWNPMATLMRTNKEENESLGRILAEKANGSKAPVAFLFPLKGLSILDGEGECFCDWETDEVLFKAIESHLNKNVQVYRVDANINDDVFAQKAIEILLDLIK